MPGPVVRIVIGCAYCLLSVGLFVLNGLVLSAILRHKEFRTTTYRIIKVMIVGCMMQLCSHIAGGVMTITSTVPFHVEKIFGAWLTSGWFLAQGASMALAVDRALIFVTRSGATISTVSFWVLTIFSVAIALLYLVIFLTPGFGFAYNSCLDWNYNPDSESMAMLTLEMVLDFFISSANLIIYVVIFICLIRMRCGGGTTFASCTVEIKILLIAVVSFIYECAYLFCFFWGSTHIASHTLASILIMILWILDCGIFAVSTLVINSSLRRKVYAPIVRSENKVTTVSRQPVARVNGRK
uniref:G_PROTEIN_RECEP_F1_2 domain-containing protein n=1 Tax=Steinernema glaseri TaxID=37863 RepID=A0A1I8AUT5_9BILA